MTAKFTLFFTLIGVLAALYTSPLQASVWVDCHGCSDVEKEQKAKGLFQVNGFVRVNVLDVESETLTTYRVTNITESEPGFTFSQTFAIPVPSTNEELEAKDIGVAFYQETQNNGTTIPVGNLPGDLGSIYGNSGYLVNSYNAANVAERLNQYFNSGFISSWNVNISQNTLGSLLSAAKAIAFTVFFPDGSTATFTLNNILTNMTADGSATVGFQFDFKLKKLKDADGNLIPMTPAAASGLTSSVSGGAMGAWNTAFTTMGIGFSGFSSGSSGTYIVTCTVSNGKLTCTAKKKTQ